MLSLSSGIESSYGCGEEAVLKTGGFCSRKPEWVEPEMSVCWVEGSAMILLAHLATRWWYTDGMRGG